MVQWELLILTKHRTICVCAYSSWAGGVQYKFDCRIYHDTIYYNINHNKCVTIVKPFLYIFSIIIIFKFVIIDVFSGVK